MGKKLDEQRTTYEEHFENLALIALSTPHYQDHPHDPNCRWGQPAIFWGGSGLGKSARVGQVSTKMALKCHAILPSQRQPEDFGGVIVPNASKPEGVSIECMLPAVRHLNKLGKGVLFLDEASNAPPAVQGAMLAMLNDRIVGDTPLAPGIRILLAANPPEIAAGGFDLEPPMANRMAHWFIGAPSIATWKRYYLSRFAPPIEPIDYEAVVKANWNQHAPMISGMLVGYFEHGGVKDAQPKAGDPQSSLAWPSGRTWEMAINAMIARRCLGLSDTLDDILVEGFVGHGHAIEFATWRREANLPTPQEVLDGKWRHNKHRLDITHAVLAAIVPHVVSKPKGPERNALAIKAWELFKQLIEVGAADLLMDPITLMVNQYQLGVTNKDVDPNVKEAAKAVVGWLGRNGYGAFTGGT